MRQLIDACYQRTVQLILSDGLVGEIGRVLHKPKLVNLHRMSDLQISRYLKTLSGIAEFVQGKTPVEVSIDPLDNILFSTALEGKAEYLISGDEKHVLSIKEFQGVHTIRPRDFVEEVLKRKKAA
jgi:putative PIN family toxin of toxin-antitoxin system